MIARTIASYLLIGTAALAVGCTTLAPPTSPEALSQGRPGYVIGYLEPKQLPDSLALLPAPPAPGSAALAADEQMYRSTRALRATPRWALAAQDADLGFPHAAQTFSCALALPISAEATPHLNMLLRRVRADASRATDKAKSHYKRRRPYLAHGEASCTPAEKLKDDSYPSGHASIGWAWALALAEIAPGRANEVLARGLAFGQSRVVCGVHWQSDVEAGRIVGAAVVSRLHADPVFTAQMGAARKEIENARAARLGAPQGCAAQEQALAGAN